MLAAALAVGLAIGAMHYLRCIAPARWRAPALTAVIGGPAVQALGFRVRAGAGAAQRGDHSRARPSAVNAVFAWRRYPAALGAPARRPTPRPTRNTSPEGSLSHSDLEYALRQINSVVDVNEDDLARIYASGRRSIRSARVWNRGRSACIISYSNGQLWRGLVDPRGRGRSRRTPTRTRTW
ncbi:MAG: hypothetical protein MZU91_08450 [Desulfosudis oleivorans]|nr:hypothetical protein [Desulfosudis oleivorans]